jgi:hypothetical protein
MQKNAALPAAALMSVQTSNLSIKFAPPHLFFSICADIHTYIHTSLGCCTQQSDPLVATATQN